MASRFTRLTTSVPKLTRGYAAAPTIIKAPITLYGLDGRYATALYTAAARQNVLEAVEKDLKSLTQAIQKDQALRGFLENPTVTRSTKMQGITSAMKKTGKPNKITENFFDTLAENGRLDQTSKVIEAFSQLMSAHRNELPLIITSAKALDKNALNKIVDSLQKSNLAEGKKLLVSNKVKPDILGGILVEIGDKSIDLTVSSKLAKLNKLITDSI
ncbi:OSCP/delta subunit of ATPase [Cokeromyces recurvatus]|uniref:OSCP/delta subunit of ATPase n=1 Tax=Cokeromyces recurvatus TaxID=90255 RepID=UPI00221EC84E|nr:OSCP/delta subunit of ATPase [Cokeromyces recurvatus]KAI7902710.1 OSCP/delta subunit of ATPase [Cokeromyces recurvatus]